VPLLGLVELIGPESVGIVVALVSRALVDPSATSGETERPESVGDPGRVLAGPAGSTRCALAAGPAGLAVWLGCAGPLLVCARAGPALTQSAMTAPGRMIFIVALRCSAVGMHRSNG